MLFTERLFISNACHNLLKESMPSYSLLHCYFCISRKRRQNERRKEKEEKRRSWYRKGNYSSVIFVPATPESSLKRSLDEDVKKSGLRIRIVEKSGMSVKRVLQRSDPFKKRTCERECCFVCRTGAR